MAKRIVPSPEFKDALDRLLAHLNANPGKADLDKSKLHVEYGFKYIRVWWAWTVLVLTPDGEAFIPRNSGGRRLPDFNKPVGNVIALVRQKTWRSRVRFTVTEYDQPEHIVFGAKLPTCEICRRTANVKRTVVGLRCGYCRGADVRHMNAVRALGAMPRANGRPLRTVDDYYRA